MLSPLILDYTACILYLFLIISIVYKRLYNTVENRYFFAVVIICALNTVLDICMESSYAVTPIGHTRLIISYLFSYGYLILRQISALSYILLIFVASNTYERLKRKGRSRILIVSFAGICLFIGSNIFTHAIFTISSSEGYVRGPQMIVLYLFSYVYAMIGIVYLCRMRLYLGTAKWISLLSMYLFMIVCVVIQMLRPGILVEMLSTSLALLLVHLITHWSKDYATYFGLYSWYEFREMAQRLVATKRQCTILILRFVNANEVRTTYGENRYNEFIRQIVNEMNQIISRRTRDYRFFYHTSGSLQVIFGENGIDIEKEMPDLIRMWTSRVNDSYTMRFGARLCSFDFPTEHLSEEEDLTGFSFIFPQYMNRDEIYFCAERAIENKAFEMYRKLPSILTRGIREKRFEMYYQPIYNLKEGMYTSAEALIRLKDPEYGYIPPGLFIPSAERRNLILPIGSFVLDSVFRFAARPDFEELGLHYIELNLSVEQLLQDNLVSEIQELQNRYGISSVRINLEITESAAGLQSKVGLRNISDLRERMFTFALDDYGTGYSNITRAVDLPLSLVKIDKSIIDRIETRKGESMIRSTIQMMHEIGFQVVAEGVETEEQYHILDYMDCDYIQGYYFAKPMNEKEFVAFLKSHNCRYQDAEVPKEAWTKHRREDGQSEKPEEGNRTDKRRNMIIRGTMKRTKRSFRTAAAVLWLISMIFSTAFCAWADDALAGFGATPQTEDPNSWDNSDPAPFDLRIRFDENYEELKKKDTEDWRRLTPAGYYIWDDDLVSAYLDGLKKKYDTDQGNVSFTTHKGVKMMISSQNCGWHMNIDMTRTNLEEGVDKGEKVIDPAWNSGCIYSSKNGVGKKYVEVSIEEQKVYLVEDDKVIFETDCVTGTAGYTDTTKGVFQVQGMASPTTLKDKDKNGNAYEQPVEYWIAFNGSQGMHDAIWRGEFGGDIYKSWGSHGCVNLPLDAAKRIYEEVYMYYPVIVY